MLWLCVLLTVAVRVVLAARTPLPTEDGVSYLWMAQQFAAGEFAAGLAEVFPPGFPLLCAPLLVCGIEPFLAGQALGIACAALTLWPLVTVARRLSPGSELPLALLWASGSLLARNAVEVYSEPPFLLAMALGTRAGLQGQWWRLGVWSGIGFWMRPEGLLLAGAFVLSHRRAALRSLLPAAGAVLLLAVVRWNCGHGFDALPIHGFHEQRDDLPGRGDVFGNLLDVPAAWFEAYGPAGLLPLLAVRRRAGREVAALGWQVALQVAVVLTFVVRRRFFLSCAVPVFLLAAVGLQGVPARWRRALLAVLVVAGLVGGWRGVIEANRAGERRLGQHLATLLQPGEVVTGDLTRVVWYAGGRPLPPRRFSTERLLEMAAEAPVRFVAVGARRDGFAELQAGLAAHFVPLELPPELWLLLRERGIAVFERR